MSNTKDYTLLTMQVYPTAPIETIGVDILNGDAELATVKGENLNLPANQWSNVQIDMSDAGISNTDFNKFNFLMALGTEDAMDVYVDNVQLGAAFFHVESIELNESSITLFPSETFALMASLFPEKATDPCVEWSSSDETVVTVTDEGIVEAVGEGTAQITATSRDMNKTATCDVAVAYSSDATLADLTVNGTTVEGFESSKLTYDMALPAGTVDVPDVAASTSDENASFKVTDASAVPGTTIVEVTAQDGETTATYEVNFTVETGILVSKVESISLYPNPAGEKVFIESDSRILSVCVKDLTGRTIIHQNGLNQTRIDLDLNNVMKGTYLIHITDEKGHVYLGKFLKR
jgi:hypothetical protein